MQRPRQVQGPKGDINVTPLVDVVLVLLIIFMVITPMLSKGADVQVPITKNPAKGTAKEQITISVNKEGKIFLETTMLSDEDLRAQLTQDHAETPEMPIFVKGDQSSSYGRVREVMHIINAAGFESVGVITKELEKN